MSRVMGVRSRKTVGYRHRRSFFGKFILQIGEEILMWDTNTGDDEPYPVIIWRDAGFEEYEAYKGRTHEELF